MKILIVMPKIPEGQEYMFPLGIAYVSASLKRAGYEVFTLNLNFYENWREALVSCVRDNGIGIAGTGGLSADYRQLREVFQAVKEASPETVTVLGGGIVTASAHLILDLFPEVDIAMQGEGEESWTALAEALERGNSLHTVPGLIFREQGAAVMTERAKDIEPLDSLPYPDYEGFGYQEAMKSMETSGYWIGDRPAFVLSSRSCPYHCTFCFHTAGNKYRRASLDHVFGEIDQLMRDYGCRDFNFSDELFGLKEDYVLEFCERIRSRNVHWSVSMRVDCITEAMAKSMSETGCKWILYGIESADDRILKSMRKNTTRKQIDEALALSRKYNLGVIGYLIFGDPEETFESVETSLAWWRGHLDLGIGMNMIRAFPGSANYRRCVAEGKIKDEIRFIQEGCPLVNTTSWTDDDYYRIYARIEGHKMYYLYPPKQVEILEYRRKSGLFVFRYRCAHCGHEETAYGSLCGCVRLFCGKCQQIHSVSLIRHFPEISQTVFRSLLGGRTQVLLEKDREEDYELGFALTEAGFEVFVRSQGRNLYEHRELWGVKTLFSQEADELLLEGQTARWLYQDAEEAGVTELRLADAFAKQCGLPLHEEEGAQTYENENLRKPGISGQYERTAVSRGGRMEP